MKNKFVFDTNALISAVLSPLSTNARAVKRAEALGKLVYSDATWSEFVDVLFRKKFDSFFTQEERKPLIACYLALSKKRLLFLSMPVVTQKTICFWN